MAILKCLKVNFKVKVNNF